MCKVRINCYRNIPLYEVLVLGAGRLDMSRAGVVGGARVFLAVGSSVAWGVFGRFGWGVFGA